MPFTYFLILEIVVCIVATKFLSKKKGVEESLFVIFFVPSSPFWVALVVVFASRNLHDGLVVALLYTAGYIVVGFLAWAVINVVSDSGERYSSPDPPGMEDKKRIYDDKGNLKGYIDQ